MAFRFPTEKLDPREHLQPLLSVWLRKIFLEDWSTKLIALAITLGLWFGITGQQTPDTRPFSEVRISFRVSGDLEISNEPLRQVEITLTGDKGKLDRLDKRDLVVSVDLSSYNQGERLVQLRPDSVSLELSSGGDLPGGIKVAHIEPSLVLLKLEPREEREVEVKPEFDGQLPEGMEIYEDETVVTPAKVRVRGPSSYVNSIDTVSTDKISLDNRKTDFTSKQVAINLLNPKITVLDTVVDVFVRIGPKRSERNFTVHAITPSGTSKTFIVTLLGGSGQLDNVDPKNIQIEFEKISEDSLQPRVSLPDAFGPNVSVKGVKPSVIPIK
jgi:YbbR domain-containing protein